MRNLLLFNNHKKENMPNIKSCYVYYVYIDAGYIQGQLKQGNCNIEFNPDRLAQYITSESLYTSPVHAVRKFYYDALDEDAEPKVIEKQKAYLDKVRSLKDTHVVLGKIRKSKKKEQKGVDVQLAVDALEAAKSGSVDVIALIAGDADFVPLVEAIRRAGPHVFVIAFNSSVALDLKNAADRYYSLPEDKHNLPQFSTF